MSSSKEYLVRSADFRMLPQLIQRAIPVAFGIEVSRREIYLTEHATTLLRMTSETLKSGLTSDKLEAVSFAQWLLRASCYAYASEEILREAWHGSQPFSLDPASHPAISDTSTALSEALIREVQKNGPADSLILAEKIPFLKDSRVTKTMALFGTNGTSSAFFLVDVAAFASHRVWAKAWGSRSVRSLFRAATLWLADGNTQDSWKDPWKSHPDLYQFG